MSQDDSSISGPNADPHLLTGALDAAGFGILVTEARLDRPGPVILYANAAMERLTGYSQKELVGATPRILQGPETDGDALHRLRLNLEEGKATLGEAINYHKDGTTYAVEWTIDPIHDTAGNVAAWVAVQRNVTRRRKVLKTLQETDHRLRVLVGELQHRTRNLMGIIRSMAQRTADTSPNLRDFHRRFITRLEALARVQGMLSRLDQDQRITFDDLLNAEITALDGHSDGTTISGPVGIRLRSSTVQTLALTLHELATNAVKHGALGQQNASLSISWSFEPAGRDRQPWLHIDWRETGVSMPTDAQNRRGGQGRELIEEALPHEVGGDVTYDLTDDGLRCTIAIPVSASNLQTNPSAIARTVAG